eukprot:m.136973 g.136973  ORF g.136973 m.136973 type:complete len:222 (-) comp11104_c0_seq1:42-707(-)
MGGLFSKKKEEPAKTSRITERDRAQLKLKQARDKVVQQRKKLAVIIDKERTAAKEFLKKGDRKSASTLMRRKKYQEKMMSTTEVQLENIELMIGKIDEADMAVKVVQSMEAGNDALKSLEKELDIDHVTEVMEDAQELQKWAAELDETLGTPLDTSDVSDEDLLADLDILLQEGDMDVEEKLAQDVADQLPEAPETTPNIQQTQEKKETKNQHKAPQLVAA